MADSKGSHDIGKVMAAYAKAFTEDLRALVGARISIGNPEVTTVRPAEVNPANVPIAQTTCKNKQAEGQAYYCTVSRDIAVTLACMLMGHPAERIKEIRALPLDAESLDAFGEVMNLGTAVLSRLFTDQYGLPPLGVESMEDVASPNDNPPWKECNKLAVVRCAISIPDLDDGSLAMIFPPDVAQAWFGMEIGGAQGSRTSATAHLEADQVEPVQIVFIEPSEDTRNEIEELEEGMVHSIWAMDPEEFDPDEMEEFAEVGAFFIEWDLSFRTGLDLLECLRSCDITRSKPILLMSSSATDSKVRTAIRSGADGFVTKPLDVDEFLPRLEPLLLDRQRQLAAG